VIADYRDPIQGEAVLNLLNQYACDPMGGGEPISQHVRDNLLTSMAHNANAVTFMAKLGEDYIGLANCFYGFSTFACAPLLNIHDFTVITKHRGKGVGKALMAAIESQARQSGCCKITLEVLEGNHPAKHLYEQCGFAGYALDPKMGEAMFWDKKLV
jgi:GNAT superfamily N-acetyltransferase